MSGGVTTNYGLQKPTFNTKPWDAAINGNFDLIDAILFTITQIPNIGGVWRNSTQYTAGQNVLDPNTLTFYQCLVTNVSAATGTFAADRIANPANWTVTSAGAGTVRYDQGQALTSGQQLQARTNIGAIDLTAPVLRYDAAQTLSYNQILQVLNNLLIDGTESSIVASSATDIGNAGSQNVVITGNATIVSFGNRPNKYKLIRFATTATLTNSSSLVLPSGANILTQAGDTALATSDASGNWYIRAYQRADGTALVAPAAPTNLLSYGVAQTLTNTQMVQALTNLGLIAGLVTLSQSQQDYLRLNTVNNVVPLTPSANTTLAAADIDRPIFAAGAITLTAPTTTQYWRSGVITNDNATTGVVTLAVPTGATLDGVTNGTLLVFPKQKVRIHQIGATAYRSEYVERYPILGRATLAAGWTTNDIALPDGYSHLQLLIFGYKPSNNGSGLNIRASNDGTTFDSGSSYNSAYTEFFTSTNYAQAGTSNGIVAMFNVSNAVGPVGNADIVMFLGDGTNNFAAVTKATYYVAGGANATANGSGWYTANANRVKALRLFPGSGTGQYNYILKAAA